MIDAYDPVYVAAVGVFVIALIRMSSPKTARSGILWAGISMLAAVAITFSVPGLSNIPLILIAIAVGGALGWYAALKVAMVNMPQMVAIYNGMGAGAASAIASIELLRNSSPALSLTLALMGALIGNVSIAGSVLAFVKLQGWINQRPITFRGQQVLNFLILVISISFGVLFLFFPGYRLAVTALLIPFFIASILYGFLMGFPIGGADMPVVIALFNAMTGLAVAFDGYSISNYAMVVAGILVGAAGTILTAAMARAMNRSMSNILFGSFGKIQGGNTVLKGEMKSTEAMDVAIKLSYSDRVMIIPGYGMAAAQAQFKIKELVDLLTTRGVGVSFAIHPVAGRMPGHMNVLLAEAGVPYDIMLDIDEANRDLESTDLALVIGANDVVNPAARRDDSPLHGMPILDVDKAKSIVVMKRGTGRGFAGITNDLFVNSKTEMLFGDASESLTKLIQEVKKV